MEGLGWNGLEGLGWIDGGIELDWMDDNHTR